MKIVTQVKLMPDAVQVSVLERSLRTVNDAANWVSEVAFEHGVPREYELRKHTYTELKAREAGIQGRVFPHQLRHTWAHTLKKVGMLEDELMFLAGWKSRAMVSRYGASAAAERAREAYRQRSPGDRI